MASLLFSFISTNAINKLIAAHFNKTYIVLKKGEEVLSNLVIESTDSNYHSVYLIPKIRDILKENNKFLPKDVYKKVVEYFKPFVENIK